MWTFEKDNEFVILNDKEIHSSLQLQITELGDEAFTKIPSLRISFQSKNTPDDIQKVGKLSIESFFKYWNKKDDITFINYMFELGFKLSKVEIKIKRQAQKRQVNKRQYKHKKTENLSFKIPC